MIAPPRAATTMVSVSLPSETYDRLVRMGTNAGAPNAQPRSVEQVIGQLLEQHGGGSNPNPAATDIRK